jgi:membrane-bound serine protease (ClpP class)
MMTLPVSFPALVVLVLGVAMFVFAVARRRSEGWLLGAGLAVSAGSTFLFQRPEGGAAVHPLLAVLVSAGTLGFFWLVIRKTVAALRARPTFDPAAIVGRVGEVRTALTPAGSVYVGGELWSARAPRPVAAGASVRVTKADGLILDVEPIEATTPKEG